MRKYSKRSLNSLRGIHPDLRRVVDRALQDSPLDFIVIEGVRSLERQKELVASGQSQIMHSRHLTGHAVDLLPVGPDGRAAFAWPLYDQLGPAVEAAAQAEGVAITWGGRWKSFKDGPHFELDRDTYPASDWTTGQAAPAPQSAPAKTVKQVSVVQGAAAVSGAVGALQGLEGTAQIIAVAGCILLAGVALWLWKRDALEI